jgi:NADP-dependent 3-hydroxy acid dehydrogenase YdfG
MSRIFITGSSDGHEFMTTKVLVQQGYSIVLHVRNLKRAEDIHHRLPKDALIKYFFSCAD